MLVTCRIHSNKEHQRQIGLIPDTKMIVGHVISFIAKSIDSSMEVL